MTLAAASAAAGLGRIPAPSPSPCPRDTDKKSQAALVQRYLNDMTIRSSDRPAKDALRPFTCACNAM